MQFSRPIKYGISMVIFLTLGIWQVNLVMHKNIKKINIADKIVQVEEVHAPDDLEKGLGDRENLCSNCGMLFVFPKPDTYSFWMKDMRFPLDILWINNGRIVHIEKNVSEDFMGIITPNEQANEVLEINAGKADEWGITLGDAVSF